MFTTDQRNSPLVFEKKNKFYLMYMEQYKRYGTINEGRFWNFGYVIERFQILTILKIN